jgi:hypothetical protein
MTCFGQRLFEYVHEMFSVGAEVGKRRPHTNALQTSDATLVPDAVQEPRPKMQLPTFATRSCQDATLGFPMDRPKEALTMACFRRTALEPVHDVFRQEKKKPVHEEFCP